VDEKADAEISQLRAFALFLVDTEKIIHVDIFIVVEGGVLDLVYCLIHQSGTLRRFSHDVKVVILQAVEVRLLSGIRIGNGTGNRIAVEPVKKKANYLRRFFSQILGTLAINFKWEYLVE
jgi:hypothetical protein